MDVYKIPYSPDGTGTVMCKRCSATGRYSTEAAHCGYCGTPLRIVEVLSPSQSAMINGKMAELIHKAGCSSLPVSLLWSDP